jgi:hypothetical protein
MQPVRTDKDTVFNQKMLEKIEKIDGKEYCIAFLKELKQKIKPTLLTLLISMNTSTIEFCVHQIRLEEFGVSSKKESNLKRYIKDKGLQENIDYKIIILYKTDTLGKNVPRQDFILSRSGVTKCLIRSQNTDAYCDQILLFERIWKNYLRYETQFIQKILDKRDDQIRKLEIGINEQTSKIESMINLINELTIQIKESAKNC